MVLTLTKINKSAAEQYTSNLAKKKKLGTIKPNEGKGEKSAMSITTGGETDMCCATVY